MMPEPIQIACIYGPTASGKTDLAIELYQSGHFEIISVDSALVYKEMNIGTAKPNALELEQAPHHLIDIINPDQAYSASSFAGDAGALINEIVARGKVPLLVGGTFLYFRALLQGLASLPEANQQVRAELLAEAEASGWQALHQRLAIVDPTAAARIHQNDQQRIQRALEVYELTGSSLSELLKQQSQQKSEYAAHKFALFPSAREVLHQRIQQRFELMLEHGLIEEVESLIERWSLTLENPALRAVGYRQVLGFLNDEYDKETLIHKGVVATRQLAKRQFTWLRSEKDLTFFDPITVKTRAISQAIINAVI